MRLLPPVITVPCSGRSVVLRAGWTFYCFGLGMGVLGALELFVPALLAAGVLIGLGGWVITHIRYRDDDGGEGGQT